MSTSVSPHSEHPAKRRRLQFGLGTALVAIAMFGVILGALRWLEIWPVTPRGTDVDELLILNVSALGQINVGTSRLIDYDSDSFREHMAREAAATLSNMKLVGRQVTKNPGGSPQLWATILIRTDQELEYAKLQSIIKTCQEQGFSNFAFRSVADDPPD